MTRLQRCVLLAGGVLVMAVVSDGVAVATQTIEVLLGGTRTDLEPPSDPPPPEPPLAGHVGYGSVTEGADSCPTTKSVVAVTSLGNSGAGTLREAIAGNGTKDCTEIDFQVTGTINLSSSLTISSSYITIDGSTAGSPGITIQLCAGCQFNVLAQVNNVRDVIVKNLRCIGTTSVHDGSNEDCFGAQGYRVGGYTATRLVFDHLTGDTFGDGFDLWENVSDVTVSNSWFRNVSLVFLISGDDTTQRRRITVYKNLLSGNGGRQPMINNNSEEIEIIGNIVYGWGWGAAPRIGQEGLDMRMVGSYEPNWINTENNIFHFVSGLPRGGEQNAIREIEPTVDNWYINGNDVPAGETTPTSRGSQLDAPAYADVTRPTVTNLCDELLDTTKVGMPYHTSAELTLLSDIDTAIIAEGACSG